MLIICSLPQPPHPLFMVYLLQFTITLDLTKCVLMWEWVGERGYTITLCMFVEANEVYIMTKNLTMSYSLADSRIYHLHSKVVSILSLWTYHGHFIWQCRHIFLFIIIIAFNQTFIGGSPTWGPGCHMGVSFGWPRKSEIWEFDIRLMQIHIVGEEISFAEKTPRNALNCLPMVMEGCSYGVPMLGPLCHPIYKSICLDPWNSTT